MLTITVTEDAVRTLYPGIDARVDAHIAHWRDSVPAGTLATPAEVMNFRGAGHGLPVEIVMGHLFPASGSCAIPGVQALPIHGPLLEKANGRPKMVKKIH